MIVVSVELICDEETSYRRRDQGCIFNLKPASTNTMVSQSLQRKH